jgi:hypothetical protein
MATDNCEGKQFFSLQLSVAGEVDDDSDNTVVMNDVAELETYSPSDETKVKTKLLENGLGICNTVRIED